MAEGKGRLSRVQALIARGMTKGLDLVTGKDVKSIQGFVDNQRRLHPELREDPGALADRLIAKRQWYGAATSFVWGLGGYWTLVPNLAHIWAHSRPARSHHCIRVLLRSRRSGASRGDRAVRRTQ